MRLVLFCSLLCIFIFPAWADELIIEPDNDVAPIQQFIQQANHSVDLILYGLTDERLLHALLAEQQRGRTVKVILEQQPYKSETENVNAIQALKANHIAWQGQVPSMHLIHQKTLIIDDKKAMVMTFNWTHATFKNERNFALIIDDAKRVKAIKAMFTADWNHVPTHNDNPDLLYSPDDSRKKLLALIDQATRSIHVYAQSLSDYQIVGALAKAARKGVSVNILTSTSLRDKQATYLSRAGVNVRMSKRYYIHAKAWIIDNKEAVIGSINITRASLNQNRELSVITNDPTVINTLNRTFNQDWQATARSSHHRYPYKQAARLAKHYLQTLIHLLS